MITVTQRPLGHSISDNEVTAAVTDSSGDALFTVAGGHGMDTGAYVFIQSDVEAYNGYKYITAPNGLTFNISDTDTSDIITFRKETEATYRVAFRNHSVVAVHNPIVYELETDLYPTNVDGEAYVPAVVTSQANENGYTKLQLSINITDATALEWVSIDGNVYQIIEAISDSEIVINHAYNAADTWLGPVIKYYNNYCINVEVWCGYEAGPPSNHPYAYLKPMAKVATLKFTPDENNKAKFSISEIVKSYIITRNKLDLESLPNNTDFSTQFYIVYYETYDESDGFEITTFQGDPTVDSTLGLAINAMMPFKSIDAGYMSEYLDWGSIQNARWLTLQSTMRWIVGQYMDLSFIVYQRFGYTIIDIWDNDEIIQSIETTGDGVIRIPLIFETAGTHCIQARNPAIPAQGGSAIVLSDMFNACGGSWVTGASPNIVVAPQDESGYLTFSFNSYPTLNYQFDYDITVAGAGATLIQIRILLMSSSCEIFTYDFDNIFSTGSNTGSITLSPPVYASTVAINILNNGFIDSKTITVNSFVFQGTPALPATALTEQMCIEVVEECDSTFFSDADIRLLEDGDYRILE